MKINILGTGDAWSLKNYNTCFTLSVNEEHFLVDCGGGNEILKQLNHKNINITDIKNIFVSHTHTDHIVGVIWVIRMLCREYYKHNIKEITKIYGNDCVVNTINQMCNLLLPERFIKMIGDKILLIEVKDGDTTQILNKKITFFDINAAKVKQFGFYMNLNENDRFTFLGDECCNQNTEKYVENSKWVFADALLAGEEGERVNPMEKHHHSTVKYISEIAERLNVENLILSHIRDLDGIDRKQFFIKEAKKYFSGNVFVPDDLEEILI